MTEPTLACDVCGQPLAVGDNVQITCIGFDETVEPREPILSYVHTSCLDVKDRQN